MGRLGEAPPDATLQRCPPQAGDSPPAPPALDETLPPGEPRPSGTLGTWTPGGARRYARALRGGSTPSGSATRASAPSGSRAAAANKAARRKYEQRIDAREHARSQSPDARAPGAFVIFRHTENLQSRRDERQLEGILELIRTGRAKPLTDRLRSRLTTAACGLPPDTWEALLELDQVHPRGLDKQDLLSVVRETLRIPDWSMADIDVWALHAFLDGGWGRVKIDAFVKFLNEEPFNFALMADEATMHKNKCKEVIYQRLTERKKELLESKRLRELKTSLAAPARPGSP